MKELIVLVGAGLVGLVTFGIIAKKYGSECTP
jgi:uncharacterized membrane protein YuzA (DUF378 family)